MSFRMTATDWALLDAAQARVARALDHGYEPEPEDLDIIDAYAEQ